MRNASVRPPDARASARISTIALSSGIGRDSADGDRHLTRDNGAAPGCRADLQRASHGGEPVGHPLKPGPSAGGGRIEAPSVVLDLEGKAPVRSRQADHRAIGGRVLGDVLQGLERAEVDRGLDVGRESSEAVGIHVDPEVALPRLGLDRRDQALVREQRLVDAASEVAQILERRLGLSSICRRSSTVFPGSRSASCPASRAFTARATSCCCAPSWMFRSRRRRSSSWAATRRCRDIRRSSTSRTLRKTMPACAARSSDELVLRRDSSGQTPA